MARYLLWIRFVTQGFQWPLRDGDEVEVRLPNLQAIARIPANVIEALIAHHLDGLSVQAYLAQAVDPGAWRQLRVVELREPRLAPRLALPPAPAPYDPAKRAALRQQRKRRKG